jgi:arginine decarboxylase
LNTVPRKKWTIKQSAETYGIDFWGDGYFSINKKGHVCVKPLSKMTTTIDLYEIAQLLKARELSFPMLVRFTNILGDRAKRLQQAFKKACKNNNYQGKYTPVYPIKVNQQCKVIEGILAAGNIGLEAGSKSELLAVMALSKKGVIICNGYKDRAYIRLALIGLKMGLNLYLVIEKPLELELIIEECAKLSVIPQLGVRIRLASITTGKWENSGGEKSKFGLHAHEVLQLLERLKQAGLIDTLKLMHFHMGSQIANIHVIKDALKEVGRYYVELHRSGAPIAIIDAGGGLGVDYDGSRSRRESSMNYSLDEYAENIVWGFADTCQQNNIPHPDIFTESGRALTAHHAVLITNVTDLESVYSNPDELEVLPKINNLAEAYHDCLFDLSEAREQFVHDKLDLKGLAAAESQYALNCQRIKAKLDPGIQNELVILRELNEKLANKVFCNFSMFQSLPDAWGVQQIFPIMPIHRLDEQPTERAVLQDLTCDSDGRIEQYIDGQNIEKTLPVHKINKDETYLIGFFMLGAYQEILGDMHNLFGDTYSINIELDEQGYHFYDSQEGEDVSDMLEYVHINTGDLITAFRKKLSKSSLSEQQQHAFETELVAGLNSYTYLEM